MYNDKNLTCADCGQEFVFTASEQDFYAQRGFTEPRRCPSCRASRKAARNAEGGGSSYGSYGAGGGYSAGGAGSYGGGGGGGGGGYRDRGPREMFAATCSNCGREAQVPFRPTSGKPVYCSDCFRSMRGGSIPSSRRGPTNSPPNQRRSPTQVVSRPGSFGCLGRRDPCPRAAPGRTCAPSRAAAGRCCRRGPARSARRRPRV